MRAPPSPVVLEFFWGIFHFQKEEEKRRKYWQPLRFCQVHWYCTVYGKMVCMCFIGKYFFVWGN